MLHPVLIAALLAACVGSDPDDGLARADRVPPKADSAMEPVALAPPADSATPMDGTCLPYEPASVTITGRLERRMFYGPPNFGEDPESDTPEPGFYLVPDAPICTRGGEDPRRDVTLVQMVLDSAGYARAQPHLDTRVRAAGRLFAAQTGHHHAELLLTVDTIVPANSI